MKDIYLWIISYNTKPSFDSFFSLIKMIAINF